MQLCDFCGFVLNEGDAKCSNCSAQIPGREHLAIQTQEPKTVVEKTGNSKFIPSNSNLGSYIPKKTLVLLLIIGILVSPQTQSLVTKSLDYWDEMNTPYYNIPESVTITFVRNFTILLESGKSSNYELILSKAENRPTWPQKDSITWQEVEVINIHPEFEETDIGRMKWTGQVNETKREYVEVSYKITVDTIRPELTPEDSGNLDDIPEGYENYLDNDWLIEPSLPEIQELAAEATNGTDGNVIQILTNIFDYINSGYVYKASAIPKSCPESIANGYGDCDDFSILFSSIARAAGIPTWMELGKIPAFIDVTNECDLRDWGGHAWVNALVPLNDGTTTVVSIDLANSYFMWMPPYRISDWVDDGDGDNLLSYYYLFSSQGNGRATYIENSYVSSCTTSGNIKLEEL